MKKLFLALTLTAALGGCSTLQNLQGVYNTVTQTTVQPSWANIALNTYYGLKQTATTYATYCVQQKFPQPTCSAANRRAVIKFIRSGDGAAKAIEPQLVAGAPIYSTAYNALVGAINGLQAAPIATAGN